MAHNPDVAREHGTSRRTATELADEANRLKGDGKERRPVKKVNSFTDLSSIFNMPTES